MNGEARIEKYTFSRTDTLAAWLIIVLGYLFVRVLPVSEKPLGAFLLLLASFAFGYLWLRRAGQRPGKTAYAFLIGAILLLPALLLTSDVTAVRWLFFFELVALMCFFSASCGGGTTEKFGEHFFLDIFRATVYAPILSLDAHFYALMPGKKRGVTRRILMTVLWILAGLCIAVIPTLVVTLLLSFDKSFVSLLDKLPEIDASWLWERLICLIFGIPVAMWLFSAVISARRRAGRDDASSARAVIMRERMRFFPPALVYAAATPILLVYVLFFISQGDLYLSAFTGVLPEGLIYSEYAVEGFEQLCIVAALNALMLLAIQLFVRRTGKAASVLLKVYMTVTAVFTLVLIATAVSKLVLYIGAYGLTVRRIHAAWFMLLLAVGFLCVILAQYSRRFRFVPVMLTCAVLLFAALAYGNVNRLAANYNADAYLDGRLQTVDVSEIDKMEEAGVPALLRLSQEATDEAVVKRARECLSARAEKMKREKDVFAFTFPRLRAERLLREKGYLQ